MDMTANRGGLMVHSIDIELPYNLTVDGLVPERMPGVAVEHPLRWLAENVNDTDEAERIMRAAVVLQTAQPHLHFADCLSTAITWGRG
jgi:hypothetical protein